MKNNTTDFTEVAAEIERVIEGHDNDKMILRFLPCSLCYHGFICIKPQCKINKYSDIVSKILLVL